jgi:hypothetical protein
MFCGLYHVCSLNCDAFMCIHGGSECRVVVYIFLSSN